MTPPDVPADRFAALRMAFEKSMKDPAYQAAVAARRLGLNPVPGEKITSLINDTLAVTPAQLASIRAAMGMKLTDIGVSPGAREADRGSLTDRR